MIADKTIRLNWRSGSFNTFYDSWCPCLGVGVGIGWTVAVGMGMGNGAMVGLCSGVGVTLDVRVGAARVWLVVVATVGDGVTIVGIFLFSCVKREMESARIDIAMMQIATRPVIITPIHLHLRKNLALFVLNGPAYAAVCILISEFLAIASASRWRASG